MQILVVGATGRTGRAVAAYAAARGHAVRAFARSSTATDWPSGVTPFAGSVLEPAAIDEAMAGVDAVIVAISMARASDNPWAPILTPLDLHRQAALNLTAAARREGVGSYVTISAHGVGDSAARAGRLFLALVNGSNIGVAYDELAHAEAVVRTSGLPWTIVRPTRLTGDAPTGHWRASPSLVTTSRDRIPRGDVAAFLVLEAETGAHRHQAVSVTGA